ncbi:MAG: GTPase [Anaerolineae bacterium]
MSNLLVAIVGRPNVGKSTLFNRFTGGRQAIVEDVPGTTRDRLVGITEWAGAVFDVVDTGGLGVAEGSSLEVGVRNQVDVAIEQAHAIVMVVDVTEGMTPGDHVVAALLRRAGKPVVLAVNKADNAERRLQAAEFWGLGIGEPLAVSTLHGSGSGDVLDALVAALGREAVDAADDDDDDRLRLAIVGRPNVGKSSLVNRLIDQAARGESGWAPPRPSKRNVSEIVSFAEAARRGGSADPSEVDDTAGIRRRGRVAPGIERYSVLRAMRALVRADVAVLVLDAVEGATAQDAHIAGAIRDAGVGALMAMNKWDLVPTDPYHVLEVEGHLRQRVKFLDYSPVITMSALTGRRAHKVLAAALEIDSARQERVPTGVLNRLVADIQARHNPPSRGRKRLRILYATQAGIAPPTFVFFVNDPELVHFSYERFVENQLRRHFPFVGSPVRLVFRPRGRSAEG